MGLRRIPLYKAFQRVMGKEMETDAEWLAAMDAAAGALPKGEAWPHEMPKEGNAGTT